MDEQRGKTQVSNDDSLESGDFEQAWRALARIIARRHISNQLNKIEGRTDKKSINHDNDNKTSNG